MKYKAIYTRFIFWAFQAPQSLGAAFALALLAILLFSAGRVLPRIIDKPLASDPARVHHDVGDGATEADFILPVHWQWKTYGYAKHWFLPCVPLKDDVCTYYTHYPPGPWLFSSMMLGEANDLNFPEHLRASRVVTYLISACLAALGLAFMCQAMNWPGVIYFLGAASLGFTRGFWLYSDNLFGHGYTFAFVGIFIGLALYMRHKAKDSELFRLTVLYAALTFITAWVSWEPLTTAWLALFLLAPRLGKRVWKIAALVIGVTVFALILRAIQNSLALGGVQHMIADWGHILHTRALALDSAGIPGRTGAFSVGRYLTGISYAWKFEMGRPLLYSTLLMSVLALFISRRWLIQAAAVFLLAVAWNYIMIPHCMHHLWDMRHVVWAAVYALCVSTTILFQCVVRANSDTKPRI